MSLLDHLDVLDLPPVEPGTAPDGAGGSGGFLDCRGVLHTWDEEA